MPATRDEPLHRSPNRVLWFLGGCLVVGLIGVVDTASGTELSFGLFYLIPVAFVTWFAGERYGLGLSAIAALAWFLADAAAGHIYSRPEIRYWNAGVRFVFFVVMTQLLPAIQARDRAVIEAGLDELTGAVNRRQFLRDAQRELVRADRYQRPFSLVYFDLDGFKAVNDRHGHKTGDRVLRAIVARTQAELRTVDVLARIGGDEFIILLPESDSTGCLATAEKVRVALSDEMRANGWSVTVSIGALTYLTGPAELDTLIARADRLMYSVKNAGKNGVAHEVWTS